MFVPQQKLSGSPACEHGEYALSGHVARSNILLCGVDLAEIEVAKQTASRTACPDILLIVFLARDTICLM